MGIRLFLPLALFHVAVSANSLPLAEASESAPLGFGFFEELCAGPLLGIDHPLKGCSGNLLFGMTFPPFEGGFRVGAAYDTTLEIALLRFDVELGLGNGLRAIVGGLLPLGELSLGDPLGGTDTRVRVQAADLPNRFGIASTLAELPRRFLGARTGIDAELVYTNYRLGHGGSATAKALSGAAAFAAGVEATIVLRLHWGAPIKTERK